MTQVLDFLGIITFSISGVLVALHKRMDPFGVFIIAFVTAVGGGTLRDLLIGNTPVSWMQTTSVTFVILGTTILAILLRKHLDYFRTSLFLFDTIGIGLYTVIGIEKGINAQLNPIICIALGTMSACFGGVIRDILCNEIPALFRKEIYATACIVGGLIYFILLKTSFSPDVVFLASGISVIVVRLIAVKFKISLPSLQKT